MEVVAVADAELVGDAETEELWRDEALGVNVCVAVAVSAAVYDAEVDSDALAEVVDIGVAVGDCDPVMDGEPVPETVKV
jgi:hypothetical protein